MPTNSGTARGGSHDDEKEGATVKRILLKPGLWFALLLIAANGVAWAAALASDGSRHE